MYKSEYKRKVGKHGAACDMWRWRQNVGMESDNNECEVVSLVTWSTRNPWA